MAADNTVRVDVILDSKTKGIEKGAAKTAELRKENERLSKVFQEVEKNAKNLDDRISALTTHRMRLAQQLSQNDDLELRKEFNRTNQRLGFFRKLQKAIAEGGKAGGGLFSGLSSAPLKGAAMPSAIGGAGVLAAAAAPPLGAMLGGAVSGTVVGAAMAGGILAASQDSSVRAAARQFGDTISKEFFASGDAFVGPIRNSLNILEADFQDLELEGAFAKVAPQVEQVAHGIGDLAKNFMPGFNRVLDRSAAFTDAFAEGLGDTGAALGKMVDDMSSSEGAIEGLHTLFMLLDGTLVALGKTVNVLSDTWDVYTNIMAGVSGVMEDVPDWLQLAMFGHNGFAGANDVMEKLNSSSFKAADGIGHAGDAAGSAATDAQKLADALKETNKQFEDYFDMEMNLDRAKIGVEKSFLDLQKTLKENGNEWDSYTEKGIENREALLDHIDALNKRREAELAAADGNEEAMARINANYDQGIARLKAMAKQAGLSEEAFMAMAGEYTVTFYLNQKVGRQVVAWSELRNAERQAESHNSGGNNKPRGFAHGGPTPAFEPFFTHPGETMWSDKQHYVATKQQTDALMRSGASGGSARPLTLGLMPGAGSDIERMFLDIVARYVRVYGDGSAETAFSGGRVLG